MDIDVERLEALFGHPTEPPPEASAAPFTVERVTEYGDGRGWDIGTSDGTGFGLLKEDVPRGLADPDEGQEGWYPRAGMEGVLHTVNFSNVVGTELDGHRLFVKSEREVNLEWLLLRANHHRTDHEDFLRNKPELDAKYEALPQVFKDRLDRFRSNNPDFRERHEPYEMFCCTEAVKFAERARQAVADGEYAAEVDAFYADPEKLALADWKGETPWEEPADPVMRWLLWAKAHGTPAFEYGKDDGLTDTALLGAESGHSGNTFGAACFLARAYIEAPEFVEQIHGALSPLVGAEEYGDVPRTG